MKIKEISGEGQLKGHAAQLGSSLILSYRLLSFTLTRHIRMLLSPAVYIWLGRRFWHGCVAIQIRPPFRIYH